ncbi:6-hydroxymethylpterin diphosphokinase MptE-like protein [Sporosarcina sp. 179-K 3D1 HS]|uniref:motility associated factor glycosyltransferase family protein n=1 Tax=Sporosarcina sp. 179-K 3D1 HS TaxID=3232169 RepID=UPI00399FA22E
MILIDNRNILRLKDKELLNRLSELEEQEPSGNVVVEEAKTGLPTIKVHLDGRTQYLQSKYDPEQEAERFVGKIEEESVKHVLFIGIGLGYHIKKYLENHRDLKFSIYEPNEEVLLHCLSTFSLEELPVRNLMKIFMGTDQDKVEQTIQHILVSSNDILKIITLPVYEKLYVEQVNFILEKALSSLKHRHMNLAVNAAFQKRWIINSIKNFPTVLKTPNILHDIDRSAFVGKPAIIVAAGPSLNEEFENLRYIKEYGLAYIFSVGSAINALIEHGVYPDAACTYDPQDINYRVIQRIKDDNIIDIPLIFGSSVGFETIENYPGQLLHMIMSQDTVAPALVKYKDDSSLDFVYDAPSIAVVAFQLLIKLGVSQIILVGQNLAYISDKHYAHGIDYGTDSQTVIEEKLKSAIVINDVHGNLVKTTDGFNRMRQELEMYISTYPSVKVWNTTKGGAAIQGTEFIALAELMEKQLRQPVIRENWATGHNSYDIAYVENQFQFLDKQAEVLQNVIHRAITIIQAIQTVLHDRKIGHLEINYTKLDSVIEKMKQNSFYNIFLEPMIRVQQDRLSQNIQGVKSETIARKKAEIIIKEFGTFLSECARDYQLAFQLYQEMKTETILY